MYPSIRYITKPSTGRWIYYKVLVEGYRDAVSIESLNSRALDAGYKYGLKGMKDPYNCLPLIKHLLDIEITRKVMIPKYVDMLGSSIPSIVEGDPIKLVDFYASIGYNSKTKKINGRTFLQHIKYYTD